MIFETSLLFACCVAALGDFINYKEQQQKHTSNPESHSIYSDPTNAPPPARQNSSLHRGQITGDDGLRTDFQPPLSGSSKTVRTTKLDDRRCYFSLSFV